MDNRALEINSAVLVNPEVLRREASSDVLLGLPEKLVRKNN